jgi:hypothetical protein
MALRRRSETMTEFVVEPEVAGIGARVRSRLVLVLSSVPAWAIVTWLAGVSIVVNVVVAGRVGAPFVFGDELTYSELARRLADQRLGAVGYVLRSGYGLVYPLTIAPAYAAFSDLPSAYAAAKVLNALLMASSVIPSYLLARRVLKKQWVVAVCALTVIGPQMIFTSTVMTENAFLPVFLTACLATVRMLERPALGRQLVCLGLVALAVLTRLQAAALLPGVAIAILVATASEGGFTWRTIGESLRPYFKVAALVFSLGAILVCAQLARAGSLKGLLGSYGVLQQAYSPLESLKWLVLNLADLDLFVGVAVFALAPLAVARSLRGQQATAESRAIAAVFLGFSTTTLLTVAAFSSTNPGGHRLHDRYLFYLVPMLLILCFRLLQNRIASGARLLTLGVISATVLPGLIPYEKMGAESWVDGLAIQPWLNKAIPQDHIGAIAVVVAALIGLAIVRFRRHATAVTLTTLFSVFLLTVAAAQGHAERNGGFPTNHANWVDSSLGSHSSVRGLFVSSTCLKLPQQEARWIAFWRAKTFNRSVQLSFFVRKHLPGDLTSARLRVGQDGALLHDGQPIQAEYVLADSRLALRGTIVASDPPAHLAVTRTDGALLLRGGGSEQSRGQLLCLEKHNAR